jgi:cell division protein FtsN
MSRRSREQVWGAVMAVLVTVIILIIFFVDSKINTAPEPTVVYVESYGPGRTDADIIRDQKKASEERRKAEEARRQEFQKLEKQLGIE